MLYTIHIYIYIESILEHPGTVFSYLKYENRRLRIGIINILLGHYYHRTRVNIINSLFPITQVDPHPRAKKLRKGDRERKKLICLHKFHPLITVNNEIITKSTATDELAPL